MTDQPGENHRKILCIEDDPVMIGLIRAILAKGGFEVTGALDGREGLRLITKARPDLVLLDLMLPDMSGWDVYQQMKADAAMRNIPIVVVTARARDVDKLSDIHLAGIGDYITKPFKPEVLLRSVNRVLGEANAAKPAGS